MQNQQLVSSSRKCSSTPADCGQGFLGEEQCENTGASHTAQADFYLFPRLKPVVKGWRFCDITDIFKNAMKELKRL
jgi:hypothetical protein